MNRKSARRHWVKTRSVLPVLVALWLHGTATAAEGPRRIVSINLCTDQLLLALAPPQRIVGLGRFAHRVDMAFLAEAARGVPQVRGAAEEVLRLRPDLVLAGAFSGRATRAILTSQGVRIETFAPPRSIGEAKAEILRAGVLLDQAERAGELIAEIDVALAEAGRIPGGDSPRTVLPLQRRGYASGRDTLVSSVLEAAGLVNAADKLGVGSIVRVPLERIVALRPDVLVVEGFGDAADQATALLRHPALARVSKASLITVPTSEVACGGPSLPALIRRIAAAARAP